MDKSKVIEILATNRAVEQLIDNILHRHTANEPDLKDLSQMIYLALLEQDEEKIIDLWENNAMNFFIVNVIKKQVFSSTSPYFLLIKKTMIMSDPIEKIQDNL